MLFRGFCFFYFLLKSSTSHSSVFVGLAVRLTWQFWLITLWKKSEYFSWRILYVLGPKNWPDEWKTEGGASKTHYFEFVAVCGW